MIKQAEIKGYLIYHANAAEGEHDFVGGTKEHHDHVIIERKHVDETGPDPVDPAQERIPEMECFFE